MQAHAQLIAAWELSHGRAHSERAVGLLTTLGDHRISSDVEQLPLGQRDRDLLSLYEEVFGPELDCLANCPTCGTQVQFALRTEQLRLPVAEKGQAATLEKDGIVIRVRVPTSHDVIAALAASELTSTRRALFRECLLSATRVTGEQIDADEVPAELVGQAARRMAELDPQADISPLLHCPECAADWEATFDIGAFFAEQLHSWASRLLHEVHELAQSYGWSEDHILSLSPLRRQAYLEFVRS